MPKSGTFCIKIGFLFLGLCPHLAADTIHPPKAVSTGGFMSKSNIPQALIEQKILLIRGHKVMVDRDLAALYGVTTGALNQAVKRNRDRFPSDFMFQLSKGETENWISQIVISNSVNMGIRKSPYVFTEHGALMAANLLKSPRAVAMSVYVIRAFVRLRETFVMNQIFEKRLSEIEKVLLAHNAGLKDLYEKIKPLLMPAPLVPKRKMGFHS